jgi:hypothetical protein
MNSNSNIVDDVVATRRNAVTMKGLFMWKRPFKSASSSARIRAPIARSKITFQTWPPHYPVDSECIEHHLFLPNDRNYDKSKTMNTIEGPAVSNPAIMLAKSRKPLGSRSQNIQRAVPAGKKVRSSNNDIFSNSNGTVL